MFIFFRRSLGSAPLSIRRFSARRDNIGAVRNSRRFSDADPALCERLSRADFEGYWICRGSINGTQGLPSQSDIVVLWIHGGAYVSGTALASLPSLLRVAEIVAEQKLSISIFTLEYSLAPEKQFPTQIDEVTAAYMYLIEEEKINTSRILLLGESAGGHLALSLTYKLQQQGLPRPGKVGLLYPWVNLENSGTTFDTNRYKDCLDKTDLNRCVDWLLGKDGRWRFAEFLNLTSSSTRARLNWSQVLPSTWIVLGGNDVLVSDVCRFVADLQEDGVPVNFQLVAGRPHGWLGFYDSLAAKNYLQLSPEDDASSIMKGSETIAKLVCEQGHLCASQNS